MSHYLEGVNWGGLVFAAAMIALVVVSGWVTERLARWAEDAGKEAQPKHVPLPVCDNMRETAVVPDGRGFWNRLPRERTGLRIPSVSTNARSRSPSSRWPSVAGGRMNLRANYQEGGSNSKRKAETGKTLPQRHRGHRDQILNLKFET